MAVTLKVELTNEQQALMESIAKKVLGEEATNPEMVEWATRVAADGLRAEVERIGMVEIDAEAYEAQNVARRGFTESVAGAWPPPEEPQ